MTASRIVHFAMGVLFFSVSASAQGEGTGLRLVTSGIERGDGVVTLAFQHVPLAAGARIEGAWLEFDSDELPRGPLWLSLEDRRGRRHGPSLGPWDAARTAGRGPNLAAAVQALVDHPRWNGRDTLRIALRGPGQVLPNNTISPGWGALHIKLVQPQNQPPVVDAGSDQGISLPSVGVTMAATVTDDMMTPSLTTVWSHAGGSGAGTVTFADDTDLSSSVTFTPDLGTYVLRLTADDGAFQVSDELTVLLSPAGISVVEVRIDEESDDAEEEPDGTVSLGSSDLELVEDSLLQTVGLRFRAPQLPPGAVVYAAWVQFTVDETPIAATSLTIRAQASGAASTFTGAPMDLTSRPRTNGSVAWEPGPWIGVGSSGPRQRTPSLVPLIQELLFRPDWTVDSSVVFLIDGMGERVAESYDGVSSAAPLLHLEYATGPVTNVPPTVQVPADRVLVLPVQSTYLDATVVDDGHTRGVEFQWERIGGSGAGAVTIADPTSIDTMVAIAPVAGTYLFRLTADDGEFASLGEVLVTLDPPSGPTTIVGLQQVVRFETGYSGGSPLTVPSVDPASVLFHPPSGRLFIADSEIDEIPEVFTVISANLFELSRTGDTLFESFDLTQGPGGVPVNEEPTGIVFRTVDEHFYISNDDAQTVTRYTRQGSDFIANDFVWTSPLSNDPEGMAYDPNTDRLFVIDGQALLLTYRYTDTFTLESVLDLAQTAGQPAGIPTDPEGITYDPITGHLLISSDPDAAIYEFTEDGVFVDSFSMSGLDPTPIAPQGLTIGPASDNSGALSLYLCDGGFDNDFFPLERDGAVYELRIQRN
ncbi:MAG: hypothetical protein GY711_05525 [bacterium]|nr:hypothetical protein [bacterium]